MDTLAIHPPASWHEPLGAYLDTLRAAGRSPGTVYQHSYGIRRFAASTQLQPWAVTPAQLAAHLAGLDVGPAARRARRAILRGFYGWAAVDGRIASSPAAQLPAVRVPRAAPRPAPEHSVRVGLRAGDERVQLMVAIAAGAGLRAGEIARVHVDDLVDDLLGVSLRVRGKGGHERLVPLPAELAQRIAAAAAGGYLFPGRIDGHLSAARVSELISAALPPGVTAHQLRHRYGTRAYQLGGRDLRAVQQLLGHASVATTQLYVAVDDDAVRRAALAAAAS